MKKRAVAVVLTLGVVGLAIYGSRMQRPGEDQGGQGLSLFGGKETIYCRYTDEGLTDYISGAAIAFGDREGVRVIPQLTDGREYLETINQDSLHSEQVPDVYIISNEHLEKAYLAGLAVPITDSKGLCTTDNFPQTALDAVTYKNKLVAYPVSYETSALVYNETYLSEWAYQQGKDLQAAIPVTLEDILNIGDTFDAPEGVESVMKWDVSDIFYNYWFVGNYMLLGGATGDDDSIMSVNNPESIACLESYKELSQFFSIESDTVTYESVVEDFMDGKTVFTIATTDIVKRLEDARMVGTFQYDYGIALLPAISPELASKSLSVTTVAAVNGYSDHQELADEFAAFLAGEYSQNLYERTGKAPALARAGEANGALSMFAGQYTVSAPLPKLLEASNYWMQLEVLFSKVWNGGDVATLVQGLEEQLTSQIIQ